MISSIRLWNNAVIQLSGSEKEAGSLQIINSIKQVISVHENFASAHKIRKPDCEYHVVNLSTVKAVAAR